MAERELPLNSPDRFSKRSPDFVLERIADVGCAGAVYRWRPRGTAEWVLRLVTPGSAQVFVDGEPWRSARRALPAGLRLIAFELRDLPPRGAALLCGLTPGVLAGPGRPLGEPQLSRADGLWRYSLRAPDGDWKSDPTVSEAWPTLGVSLFDPELEGRVVGRLQHLGALALGIAEQPVPPALWVIWRVTVGESA